jgi:hypothetical protein
VRYDLFFCLPVGFSLHFSTDAGWLIGASAAAAADTFVFCANPVFPAPRGGKFCVKKKKGYALEANFI